MKRLFWNDAERRLRAFWRLLIQGIAWGIVQMILISVIIVPLVGLALASGEITQGTLSDFSATTEWIMSSPTVQLAATFASLLATLGTVWLAGRLLDRRPFKDFGLSIDGNWWADLGFGLLLGAVLMLGIFLLELAAGWVTVTGTFTAQRGPFALAVLIPLLSFIMVGIYEELFSRGYQLTNFAEGFGNQMPRRAALLLATVITATIFGVMHALNPNASLMSTVNLILAGLFLAVGYLLTGRLGIPIGLHIAWNFFQGNVFGFPVSGTSLGSGTFIAIAQGGPDLWTGGAFGPEAGLIGIGAMLVGSALTVWWVRWREGSTGLVMTIATYEPSKPDVADNTHATTTDTTSEPREQTQ